MLIRVTVVAVGREHGPDVRLEVFGGGRGGWRLCAQRLGADAGPPDWIAVDESVWVSNRPKDSVARFDPKTNTVAAMIPVGKGPCSGLATGFGSLWVPNCGDKTIARVDLKSNAVTATVPTTI